MANKKYLIIAGSTKCGTTSLFKYLVDNPVFKNPYTKETRFFLDDRYPLKKEVFGKSKDGYINLFKGEGRYCCEATPDYLYSDTTPEKIKEVLGDEALIVLIFRDPVDRILSWFRYSKQIGELDDSVTLRDFLKLQKSSYLEADVKQFELAVEQSNYYKYVEKWCRFFRVDEDFVIYSLDDLNSKPGEVVRDIVSFFGEDDSFYESYNFMKSNETKKVKYKWLSVAFFFLTRRLQFFVMKFPKIRPALKFVRKKAEGIIFQKIESSTYSEEDLEEINLLRKRFEVSGFKNIRDIS